MHHRVMIISRRVHFRFLTKAPVASSYITPIQDIGEYDNAGTKEGSKANSTTTVGVIYAQEQPGKSKHGRKRRTRL